MVVVDEAQRPRPVQEFAAVQEPLSHPHRPHNYQRPTKVPMSLDPYVSCPCGSGKKFKWCCAPYYPQVEKAFDLERQGQHEAARRRSRNSRSRTGQAGRLGLLRPVPLQRGGSRSRPRKRSTGAEAQPELRHGALPPRPVPRERGRADRRAAALPQGRRRHTTPRRTTRSPTSTSRFTSTRRC